MKKVWTVTWVVVFATLMTLALYMPLCGLGSLAWNHFYSPFLDAVDRGDAWAMATVAVFVVTFLIYVKETAGSREYGGE
jgi:hypothetical protein